MASVPGVVSLRDIRGSMVASRLMMFISDDATNLIPRLIVTVIVWVI